MFFQCSMGQNTLKDVIDKMNIRELIEFERYCMDYGMWDMFQSCYSDDGQVTDCWIKGDISSYTNAARTAVIPVKHKIFDTLIWKNGRKAVAECLAMYESRCPFDEDVMDLSAHVRFHYRLEKQNGNWKILSVIPIYEKDTMGSMYADGSFRADRQELAAQRSSYANVMLLQRKYGRTPDDTLPGEDRPELVTALYEETSRWLGM